ncbi:hypothetical protein [Pseudomonas sp. TE3610]
MKTSVPLSLSKPAYRLGVSKSLIVLLVAISLVVVETFSGALRFFLDQAGLSVLMYPAKAACLALFAVELLNYKGSRSFWVLLVMLAIAAVLGMLNGAAPGNIGFAFYMYSPFLFGLVCGVHLEHRKRALAWIIGLCLLASLAGLVLDMYSTVPWKGYSYNVGDTEVSANQAWSTNGVDRIAGFTRLSTTLSVLIAIFSLYLTAFIRSRLVLLAMFATSMAAIYLTTNKSTAVAYGCTLALMPLLRHRLSCRIVFAIVVAIGIILPVIGLTMDFDPHAATAQTGFLSSFYDRLINTWPNVVGRHWVQGWSVWGAGFGMVGSTVAALPVYTAFTTIVADNSALYLWATFGFAGLALYFLMLPLMIRLRDKSTRMSRALVSICFCLVLVSWTTDVPEIAVADLFLGLAVSVALRRKTMPANVTRTAYPWLPRHAALNVPSRLL